MAAAVIPTTDAARQGSTTGGRPTSASSEAPGIESDQTLVAPHDDAIPAAAAAEREDDPRCRLCGKSFRSMKSLYGHMRVHERNWRGVNPPTRDENASALPLIGTAWPGRGNRGRRGKPDLDPDDFDDEEHRAAKLLQRLSEEFRARRKQDERRNDAAPPPPPPQPPPPPPSSSSSTCATSEMEKKMKAEDATRQYVYGTYNNAFASRHGLGGHMVSHNKGRRNSSQVLGTSEWEPKRADDAALIDPPHGVHMKASDGEHRCELCGKVFLSGPALGGHKRAHYQQKPAAMGDTTSQASHPPYTIDLNKEPQP